MADFDPEAFTAKSAVDIITQALELDYFHPDDTGELPIPYKWVEGAPGPLVLVLGENASGKSFFRRIVSLICRKAKVEIMPISMEGRGQSYGGLRGLIYGDETWQSTGECSSVTITTGIKTCLERTSPHVIFWDEPDLGLSDSWAAGAGVALRGFIEKATPQTHAVFVVTHNRALVSQLVGLKPHYLYLGDGDAPPTVEDWLARPIVPRNIEDLREASYRRFKKIQVILDSLRKA